MAEKTKEDKIILEREYIIPIRMKAIKCPRYKRTPRAVKILRKFIARHMSVRERPDKYIKLDKYLNEEIWSRSIRKPPAKLRVKCKKYESGKVTVELAELPEYVKWKKLREEKSKEEVKKIEEKKAEEKPKEEKVEETKEEKKEEAEKKVDSEEKKDAVVEAGLKQADLKAKQAKHEVKGVKADKQQSIQRTRKAMQR